MAMLNNQRIYFTTLKPVIWSMGNTTEVDSPSLAVGQLPDLRAAARCVSGCVFLLKMSCQLEQPSASPLTIDW